MMKPMFPLIAGLMMTGMAYSQQSTTQPESCKQKIIKRVERIIGSGSFLGVHPADLSADKARDLGVGEGSGVLLESIVDNSPASKAGLQKNDVIVSWNGTAVTDAGQLRRLIAETPADKEARVGYVRAGSRQEVAVKLAGRPMPHTEVRMFRMGDSANFPKFEDMQGAMPFEISKQMKEGAHTFHMFIGRQGRMGATLQNMDPQLAKFFGLSDRNGALVGSVREKSAAAEAGMQAGDVIIAIDGEQVQSPGDALRIITGKPEGTVRVTVLRDKVERTLTVALQKQELPQGFDPEGHVFQGIMPFQLDEPLEMFMAFPDCNGVEEEIEIEEAAPELDEQVGNPKLGGMAPDGERRIKLMRLPAPPQPNMPPAAPHAPMMPPPPAIEI